jgi:hypothetical protein
MEKVAAQLKADNKVAENAIKSQADAKAESKYKQEHGIPDI